MTRESSTYNGQKAGALRLQESGDRERHPAGRK